MGEEDVDITLQDAMSDISGNSGDLQTLVAKWRAWMKHRMILESNMDMQTLKWTREKQDTDIGVVQDMCLLHVARPLVTLDIAGTM